MPSSILRPQPTPLLGRANELEFIRQRMFDDHVRMLTLTGPPGVGRTRLALEAGEQLTDRFPDGVSFVQLASIQDADGVIPAIARSLGVVDRNGRPLQDRLTEHLHDRSVLLILDNFERVLPAGFQLAAILAVCPGVALLVTSRVPLHLRWERTLRIMPLGVPALSPLPSLDELTVFPSIALFLARTRAINPDFALTDDNARAVAELVVRLDGLPLAVELTAARTTLLSPQMILDRWERRLSLLHWEAQDLPERQHSVGSAIAWSYDLLSDAEQTLFNQLGVFVGGFELEAAEAILEASAGETMDLLRPLESLVDESLIQAEGQGGARIRYTMLESIREYAWQQLEAHRGVDAAARAHATYFLELAERADPRLRTRDQRTWYLRLEQEHDNLRVALRWLLEHGRADLRTREMALRLAAALGYFWILRGYHAEGRRWLEEALHTVPDADPAIRTRALLSAGLLLTYGGDLDQATVVLEEALALAQQLQNRSDISQALTRLGARAVLAGNWPQSIRPLQEALRHWEQLGNQFEIGVTLFYQGSAAFMQREYERAATLYSDGLTRFQAIGNERASGAMGFYLGLCVLQLGDLARAARLVQEGVRMTRTLQDRWHLSIGMNAALSLIGERAKPEERARLLGAGDTLRKQTGSDQTAWEQISGQRIEHLREQLEHEGWGAAYREGRALSFEDVATLSLTMLEDFSRTLAGPETTKESLSEVSLLSDREQEVLRLVAEGLSSRAIGKQLFISVSTVNYHLTSIFNKLGVDTRAQAVAVAAQRGIL